MIYSYDDYYESFIYQPVGGWEFLSTEERLSVARGLSTVFTKSSCIRPYEVVLGDSSSHLEHAVAICLPESRQIVLSNECLSSEAFLYYIIAHEVAHVTDPYCGDTHAHGPTWAEEASRFGIKSPWYYVPTLSRDSITDYLKTKHLSSSDIIGGLCA